MGFMWQGNPPEQLLTDYFAIETGFHPGQREIIEQLVLGKRVLAIQRTGWGKSLCYQMASLYFPHLTIVFSPLKALMRDQCQRCNNRYSIPAAIISSDFSEEENKITLERAVMDQLKLLFIAPERLGNVLWQSYVSQMHISMLVVDEAHCISTWGHDFRPDYRRIVRLLEALPSNVPVLGLTATANKRVEADVLQQMGKNVHVIRGTMQRPNLYLHVQPLSGDKEKLAYLATILPHCPGTGIVYTTTQRNAEIVATFLIQQGLSADYYHASRDDDVRQDIEKKLMANQYKVICSTNALGMGIDKRDVRFIVHYQIPASPIHYYQEMGRAGRDGDIAWCILLYDPQDLNIQNYFIMSAKPTSDRYETALSTIRASFCGLRESDLIRSTGFAKKTIQNILKDLEDQGFIERNSRDRTYTHLYHPAPLDFSAYDSVREYKLQELNDMQVYSLQRQCLMGYLTTYLGDQPGYACGMCSYCQPKNFPLILPTQRIQEAVDRFLEELLPSIEKRGTIKVPVHENGWSLSYHGGSRIGKLVRASKYEGAGPFPIELVTRAAEVIRSRYPIQAIDAIVGVPPTRSGMLVEDFARQVAALLHKPYLPIILKVGTTLEQKELTNKLQKEDNVKGAFAVQNPAEITTRTLVLIDDIYDSGCSIKEVGRTLMLAGARAIYPFTITRTMHSDDQ